MIKFEEHEGKLFRMLDKPVPLAPDAEMPCLVRLIQDDSLMGRYNRDASYSDVIGKLWVAQKIKENPYYSNTLHAYYKDSNGQDSCIASIHELEIIGYPVEEGSHWWALYQMMQGKKVRHKYTIGNVCCALNQDGNVQYYHMDNLAYIGKIRSKLEFVKKNVAKTGWQIYEPEPEPAKKPEIVAHKQHANCLVCGKEIKGLLDRHATVSIKRYSISSLYESTYSHYCGKCFLELGFDATERKLRNRQQPKPEPEQPKSKPETLFDTWQCPVCGESISAEFEDSGHPRYNEEHLDENLCFAIGDHMKYSHTVEQPKYKVGDWVEMDYKGTLYHRQVISVHDNGIRVEFGGATPLISFDGKSSMLLIRLVRKLSPSEVVIHIGCLSGTVEDLSYAVDGRFWLIGKATERCPVGMFALLYDEMLDTNTRSLVESLLKAQEDKQSD